MNRSALLLSIFVKISWLTIIFGSTTMLKANCDSLRADFMFEFLTEDTLLLYSAPEGNYRSIEWEITGGTLVKESGNVAVVLVEEEVVKVCLIVLGSGECQSTVCEDVYFGHEAEMCNLTDCIWPGDTNGDGSANHIDLLYLGLEIGQMGHPREHYPYPEDPMRWAPSFNIDWGLSKTGVDLKHMDCDGDGVVDEMDALAISKNYRSHHTTEQTIYDNGVPLSLTVTPNLIYDGSTLQKILFRVGVAIGTERNRVTDLHGVAFRLNFDQEALAIEDVQFADQQSSILGSQEDLLSVDFLAKAEETISYYDFGLTQKSGEGTNDLGTVASFNIISADVIEFLNDSRKPFKFSISNVKLISTQGQDIPFVALRDTVCINPVEGILTNTNDPFLDNAIRTFPNPASTEVTLEVSEGFTIEQYQIFNINGQLVQQDSVQAIRRLRVPLHTIESGLYYLVVSTNRGVVNRKLIID